MLYGGYYNISRSQASSRANSAAPSRRPSKETAASTHSASEEQTYQPTTASRRSSLKKALDFLSPYEREDKVEAKKAEKKYKWNMSKAQYELVSAAA